MTTSIDPKHDVEKRRLRSAIARSRRRIDHRLRNSRRASGRLISWKTYVARWPGLALVAGLGFGWILAAGLRPRFLMGLFSARIVREATTRVTDLLSNEVKRFWEETRPSSGDPSAKGVDDA